MFRCITELRGLVIDLESFTGINITRWRRLNQQFKCLFLISDHAKEQQIRDLYPGASIYYMEDYLRLFAPSLVSHTEVINHLNMKATEIAYISRDHEFLSHGSKLKKAKQFPVFADPFLRKKRTAVRVVQENDQGHDQRGHVAVK